MTETPNHSPLPTTLDAVDWGSTSKWIMRYNATCQADDALAESYEALVGLSDERDELTTDVHGFTASTLLATSELRADPSLVQTDLPADIGRMARQVSMRGEALAEKVTAALQKLQAAEARSSKVFGQVGEKEFALGQQLQDIPLAGYILSSIGVRPAAITPRWTQVRGSIELFRHLHGEQRPDVVLGPGNDEAWSKHTRSILCKRIGMVQLAHIMFSSNPTETAVAFGQAEVIANIGLPPRLKESQVAAQLDQLRTDTWLQKATRLVDTDNIK